MNLVLRVLVLGLISCLAFHTADGSSQLAAGYVIRLWQTDDGLPENLVTCAVQTHDGYLWFGTHGGLARFDGVRFKVYTTANTPEIRDRRISSLYEDPKGRLWIGQESGAISRLENGIFTVQSEATRRNDDRVLGIGHDEQKRVWALHLNGELRAIEEGIRIPSLMGNAHASLVIWASTHTDCIWISENGYPAFLKEGKLQSPGFEPGRYDQAVVAMAGSHDGGIWIARDGRLRKWKEGKWINDRGTFPWNGPLTCSLELKDGTLAIGTTREGIYLIYPDSRPPTQLFKGNGLPQDWVRFLYEDRESNLWAGIGNTGLVSIHKSAFSVLNAPDMWNGCSVLAVSPGKNNSLWIGTDGAGLYHFADGAWRHYGAKEGLANDYIWSVAETPNGEVWAGNYWWGGPYKLSQGRFIRPANVDENWSPAVALLPIAATGELLIGNRDGILSLKGEEEAQWLIRSPFGTSDDVTAISLDHKGTLWCGFSAGGLSSLHQGTITRFPPSSGLNTNAIQCLYSDVDDTLWVGTADAGLARLKHGRFSRFDRAQGLASDGVCHILDDSMGNLWLSTHHGIQRIPKEPLNALLDGKLAKLTTLSFGREDGLPVLDFAGGRLGAGCRTADGMLWFASSQGLLRVNPAHIQSDTKPPPVVLESCVVDAQVISIDGAGLATALKPDHEHIEFHYSGLSYVSPHKLLFKYQLKGIDKTWVEAGNRRTAFYSRLPAGTYEFTVICCNNGGSWSKEGIPFRFTVVPFFWQTLWFEYSLLLLLLSAVVILVRFVTKRRLQKQVEHLRRKHEVERERSRIARDIHDDVGTSLAQITMLSQPGQGMLDDCPRALQLLNRIYATSRGMTRSLDEIVWAVDPRHDTLESLLSYLGAYATDYLASAGIRCRLDPPIRLPDWTLSAAIRHNLFLIIKETLNNVVRHSKASEVRLSSELTEDCFVLTLSDNGTGIEEAATKEKQPGRIASGNGLGNIHKRASAIGAACQVSSAPGQGTQVAITIHRPALQMH